MFKVGCFMDSYYYISNSRDEYLWKDGSVNNSTGFDSSEHSAGILNAPGFWRTREEAQHFLDLWLESLHQKSSFDRVFNEGYDKGYDKGHDKGFRDGKKIGKEEAKKELKIEWEKWEDVEVGEYAVVGSLSTVSSTSNDSPLEGPVLVRKVLDGADTCFNYECVYTGFRGELKKEHKCIVLNRVSRGFH